MDHWLSSTCTAESAVLTGRIYRIELLSNVINVKKSTKTTFLTGICVVVLLALDLVETAHDKFLECVLFISMVHTEHYAVLVTSLHVIPGRPVHTNCRLKLMRKATWSPVN